MLMLAVCLRILSRERVAAGDLLPCLLGDVAISFAARGAAIIAALWVWWRNAWWIKLASTIYAYAAADVILVLFAAAALGAWVPARPGAPAARSVRPA
jgi:hypothetical protein